jgi:phage tail-like protein
MAILRGNPYAAFNYRVSIGGAVVAGFCEISGLCADVAVVEYREGGDPDTRCARCRASSSTAT